MQGLPPPEIPETHPASTILIAFFSSMVATGAGGYRSWFGRNVIPKKPLFIHFLILPKCPGHVWDPSSGGVDGTQGFIQVRGEERTRVWSVFPGEAPVPLLQVAQQLVGNLIDLGSDQGHS